MDLLVYIILMPVLTGVLCFVLPKRISKIADFLALLVSLWILYFCGKIFLFTEKPSYFIFNNRPLFMIDDFSSVMGLAIAFFGVLTVFYSLAFRRDKEVSSRYFASVLWILAASLGVVFAQNSIIFFGFWLFLSISACALIAQEDFASAKFAKKMLEILFTSDILLLSGLGITWYISKSFFMSELNLVAYNGLAIGGLALLCMGAFIKSGIVPFHFWVPPLTQTASVPTVSLLPATTLRILGFYLLARITQSIFVITSDSVVGNSILIFASITILTGVIFACRQKDLKQFLSYQSIAQMGFVILGVGSATAIGFAGSMLHAINSAIFLSCLFFIAGCIEKNCGTTDLEKLKGLKASMPLAFVAFLAAGFAISGIPLLNGFISQWMIYRGLIQLGDFGSNLYIAWIAVAIFGSGLTLAYFLRLMHKIFLGTQTSGVKSSEAHLGLYLPIVISAFLCIVFGILYRIPLNFLIFPNISVQKYFNQDWCAGLPTAFILAGMLFGYIIYLSIRKR